LIVSLHREIFRCSNQKDHSTKRLIGPTAISTSLMAPSCIYFQKGYCRYGDACLYRHETVPKKKENLDTELEKYRLARYVQLLQKHCKLLSRKMWRYTNFTISDIRGKDLGWDDVSPEEMMWAYHDAKRKHMLKTYYSIVKDLEKKYKGLEAIFKKGGYTATHILKAYLVTLTIKVNLSTPNFFNDIHRKEVVVPKKKQGPWEFALKSVISAQRDRPEPSQNEQFTLLLSKLLNNVPTQRPRRHDTSESDDLSSDSSSSTYEVRNCSTNRPIMKQPHYLHQPPIRQVTWV